LDEGEAHEISLLCIVSQKILNEVKHDTSSQRIVKAEIFGPSQISAYQIWSPPLLLDDIIVFIYLNVECGLSQI